MSFILDALRKSEHERERRQLPGLADAPVARREPSRLPLVLGGVAVLLAVNLVVLIAMLARDDAGAGTESASPPVTSPGLAPGGVAPEGTAAAAAAPIPGPDGGFPVAAPPPPRAVRSLADEAIAATPASDADAVSDYDYAEPPPVTARAPVRTGGDSRAEPTLAPPPGEGRVGLARPPAGAFPAPRATATLGVPSIHDLTPQATAGLPTLNVNLHVYAADPAQRFVVLNGTRYREGGRLTEGPLLERITVEGAVLNHNGLRFLLPRD